ncbi:MAG: hypothetical protein K2F93_07050 [Muribaculaceae bacterium]|nr:hypothetical protein [Bacteroides sp.]MDE6057757.1 hypothetical protein [Muribaculaceae bacterium]MDE6856983.1 hypothetical protein [Muribaculaceae bacterium]
MIRFRMVRINVDQFAILAEKVPAEGVSFSVHLGFNVASNAARIACIFTIEFTHVEMPLLKLSINCEFDVMEEDWKNYINDKILTIAKEDLGFFANQTVGVARGILFCKTENTDFQNLILPPVNLIDLINQDLVIDLSVES